MGIILEDWVYNNLQLYGNCVIPERTYNKYGAQKIKDECLERGYVVNIEISEYEAMRTIILQLVSIDEEKGEKKEMSKKEEKSEIKRVCNDREEKSNLDMLLDVYARIRTQLNVSELEDFSCVIAKDIEETKEVLRKIQELPVSKIAEMVKKEKNWLN